MPGQKDKDERERDERERDEARRRFEEDLKTREEAAPAAEDGGDLPPGATHEIEEDGTVRRRRFNAT